MFGKPSPQPIIIQKQPCCNPSSTRHPKGSRQRGLGPAAAPQTQSGCMETPQPHSRGFHGHPGPTEHPLDWASSFGVPCEGQQEEGGCQCQGTGPHPPIPGQKLMVLAAKTEQGDGAVALRCDIQPGDESSSCPNTSSKQLLAQHSPLGRQGHCLTPSLCPPVHKNLWDRREDAGCEVLPRQGHRAGL